LKGKNFVGILCDKGEDYEKEFDDFDGFGIFGVFGFAARIFAGADEFGGHVAEGKSRCQACSADDY
jgi:hypothetical protein